jgi:hypothetical protein
VTGSHSTAELLTGTTAGVVAVVTLGLAQTARRAGMKHPRTFTAFVWLDEPFTAIATWPVIWIPALLAPVGIFLHIVSIRQSFARFASHR